MKDGMIDKVREFYDNYLGHLSVKNNRHSWVLYSLDRFIPKDTTVLDIGCGTGITSKHLAKDGRSVIAIDLSPKLIEYAKEHNDHEGISYMSGDICGMELRIPFDAIVMVDVLEHVLTDSLPDLFAMLSDCSHAKTTIYLNIPYYELSKILEEKKSDLRQIVDNPISIEKTLEMFSAIGFVPIYFQLYWQQYVEYVFVKREQFNESILKAFNIKEKSDG
jgi:2-polyprenyl-3-methyl-5-hydroxy-6-metoxy-1,4-benzoquinol methylase